MLISFSNFLYMNGYGYYIWSAYGCVALFLSIHWLIPWLRLKKLKKIKNNE